MDELLRWLDDHGRTQAWLADALGVWPETVSRWRSGQLRPSPVYVARIAELTGGAVMLRSDSTATHPLFRWIEETGRTQRWLAEQIGVREQAVVAWKNGRLPRAATIQRIAEVTDWAVPPEAWFDRPADALTPHPVAAE